MKREFEAINRLHGNETLFNLIYSNGNKTYHPFPDPTPVSPTPAQPCPSTLAPSLTNGMFECAVGRNFRQSYLWITYWMA